MDLLHLDNDSLYEVCAQSNVTTLLQWRKTHPRLRQICSEELVNLKALALAYAIIYIGETEAGRLGQIKLVFKGLPGYFKVSLNAPIGSSLIGFRGIGFTNPIENLPWLKDNRVPIILKIIYKVSASENPYLETMKREEAKLPNFLPGGEFDLVHEGRYSIRVFDGRGLSYEKKKDYTRLDEAVKDLVALLTTYEIEFLGYEDRIFPLAREIEAVLRS